MMRTPLQAIPEKDLSPVTSGNFNWLSEGNEPRFKFRAKTGQIPSGWVSFRMELKVEKATSARPCLIVGKMHVLLAPPKRNKIRVVVHVPDELDYLALIANDQPGRISLGSVTIQKLSKPELAAFLVSSFIRQFAKEPKRGLIWSKRLVEILKQSGFAGIRAKLRNRLNQLPRQHDYSSWVKRYDVLTDSDRAQIRSRIQQLRYRPFISVVVPVYNIEEKWLRLAIESVRRQLYPNWELCIADDCSTKPHIKRVLREYESTDQRIKVVYREKNGHISEASNSALELARGDYVALLDHDDELSEHALYMVAEELNQHPETDLIYSDEDKIDKEGTRSDPHFKPEWNPDLFYSLNLITHLAVYRTKVLKEIGGFRKGFEGSQDYDLALRVVERTNKIRHIPFVLYHWRAISGSVALAPGEKTYAHERARKALRAHFQTLGKSVEVIQAGNTDYHRIVYPLPTPAPSVSLIVPTRDHVELMKVVCQGILHETDYPNFELLIVDNQSQDPETFAYFDELRKDPRVRILRFDHPFNYSAINNFAVRESKGELIGLINNDIKVTSPGWLRELASHAMRTEVGVVGAKLYYGNDSIQHAGVVVGIGGIAGHAYRYLKRSEEEPFYRLHVTQNYSAVTGACLLTRKEVFQKAGGLDQDNLAISFNDIDFCLRVGQLGLRIVWTPFAELYHLESVSRGPDTTPTALPRARKEEQYMLSKWGRILSADPCYSPNLTLEFEDFTLAYPPRVIKPWRNRTPVAHL